MIKGILTSTGRSPAQFQQRRRHKWQTSSLMPASVLYRFSLAKNDIKKAQALVHEPF
ncbi:MAG: hypothetical protein KME05_03390 [Gloeocapsa sp. UFS-A4-WI-NPMV-4B04]|jgi:hypothetical protein|nr:hypothetical protein [Gloeocapsa sp. UFS-A4-WI-NPMV-4B04]